MKYLLTILLALTIWSCSSTKTDIQAFVENPRIDFIEYTIYCKDGTSSKVFGTYPEVNKDCKVINISSQSC